MKLIKLYQKLLKKYGKQHWWPTKSKNKKSEIIIGAILAQRTSWKNAELAIENLRKNNLLDLNKLAKFNIKDIEKLVKPSGFYKQKARRILRISKYLSKYNLREFFSRDLETIRNELLSIKGIGFETADSILLYAGDKLIFPVDAYTFRIFKKFGYFDKFDYEKIRKFIEKNIPGRLNIYKEFRALLVRFGKSMK
ncbi:MAG: endonuclease III domain-containing protein [Methanosarcinales archaeon]